MAIYHSDSEYSNENQNLCVKFKSVCTWPAKLIVLNFLPVDLIYYFV